MFGGVEFSFRGWNFHFRGWSFSFGVWNFPLKSGGAVIGGGLALLSIEVTIGVVCEHCGGLTIPTVDHLLINAGWQAGVVLQNGAISEAFATGQPAFMGAVGPR